MVTKELTEYINAQIKAGKKREEIINNLTIRGWKEEDLDSAFKQLPQMTKGESVGKSSNHKTLIIVALLIFLLFFTIAGIYAVYAALSKVSVVYNLAKDLKPTASAMPSKKPVISEQKLFSGVDCGIEKYNMDFSGSTMQKYPKLECFIAGANICKPSKLQLVSSFENPSFKVESTVTYSLAKVENGCELDISQGDINYILPAGVPENILEPLIAPLKKLENTQGSCIFANNKDLSDIFERLKRGDFSLYISTNLQGDTQKTDMFTSGSCKGSYFEAIK